MPERPLLPLQAPDSMTPPTRRGGPPNIRRPTHQRQVERIGPALNRLAAVVNRPNAGMVLREDPVGLAPERVVVFEVAGEIARFSQALQKVPGFEMLLEYKGEFTPNEDFAIKEKRKNHDEGDRADKQVPSRFYLLMPDITALRELIRLWRRWEANQPLGHGFTPFRDLFQQLNTVRPWGPTDRISEGTLNSWRDELASDPRRTIRAELELWFYRAEPRRRISSNRLRSMVISIGGAIVDEVELPQISFHGLLVDVPADEIEALLRRDWINLALAADVMLLRPQSILVAPYDAEIPEGIDSEETLPKSPLGAPIAALLDGVPVTRHELLADRLKLDDPNDLQNETIVARRLHGTAMASIIIHGDLGRRNRPIERELYVRPVMSSPSGAVELTDGNRLVVDLIYEAVVRIKGSDTEPGEAPDVFLINLSVGDPRRPFTGLLSPLVRLLDYLSWNYQVLFLVSAGNIDTPLVIQSYQTWTAFEDADPSDRERAVIEAVAAAKQERTILSPSEAINAVTIGSLYSSAASTGVLGPTARAPYTHPATPNVSSAIGLGFRRSVKPDLLFPGGEDGLSYLSNVDHLRVKTLKPVRNAGILAAQPDNSPLGGLNQRADIGGTSAATALATRAAHLIFDALMADGDDSVLADLDPAYYAVVIKALLYHRAKWPERAALFRDICGPSEPWHFTQRSENIARFLGYGIPEISEAIECSRNRATLLNAESLTADSGRSYSILLPACLHTVTLPRSLTITLAWISPIKAGHQDYRGARLEVAPRGPGPKPLGTDRLSPEHQPTDAVNKRGTVFHARYSGAQAMPYLENGRLELDVWCKDDAGADGLAIPYCIVVSVESEEDLPIYDEIRELLRVRPKA